MALVNFKDNVSTESTHQYLKNVIMIKEGDLYHKVELDDIVYIKCENVYLHIHTRDKIYLIRNTLESFLKNEVKGVLFKIHKSYAVNLKYLENVKNNTLKVAGIDLPILQKYKDELLNAVPSLK
jgi:DNA-binding LytR/AlgR family response regulator